MATEQEYRSILIPNQPFRRLKIADYISQGKKKKLFKGEYIRTSAKTIDDLYYYYIDEGQIVATFEQESGEVAPLYWRNAGNAFSAEYNDYASIGRYKARFIAAQNTVLFAFTRNGQLSVLQSVVILLFFVAFLAESLIAGKREQGTEASEDRPELTAKTIVQNLFSFVLGAAAIVLGAQLLIDNGSALAQMIGVPDSIIAATMIAIGTSLPELVTTLTAIRKKESSLSVGNIIGANIMDLTLIMPLCALIQGKPMMIERQGMLLDIPACLVVTAAALVPALVSGRFKRWMGFLIGGLYIAYLVIMFTCFGV